MTVRVNSYTYNIIDTDDSEIWYGCEVLHSTGGDIRYIPAGSDRDKSVKVLQFQPSKGERCETNKRVTAVDSSSFFLTFLMHTHVHTHTYPANPVDFILLYFSIRPCYIVFPHIRFQRI